MPGHPPVPVPADRVALILASLLRPGLDSVSLAKRLCDECVRALDISGVGLILMSDEANMGVVAVTDGPAAQMEELQFATGEGPCVDASRTGRPVLQPDLRNTAMARWPGFGSGVLSTSIQAIFAFPLQVGAIRIGVLDLYRDMAGELSADHLADALAFADVAILILLELQNRESPFPGATVRDPIGSRAVIHQATGMVAVQLSVGLADALLRMRASAYASNLAMADIAADVVSRRIRFDDSFAGTSTPDPV